MTMVSAKCTNCNANLQVDGGKEAAICEFCGTAFITEKAVNNYHISNTIHNTISAGTVNIYGGSDDFVIKAGVLEEYKGAATDVVIPDSVVVIGKEVFKDMNTITSVTIPNSVKEIGAGAFMYCSGLTSITMSNSVTSIERDTFRGCSALTSVTIPDGVKYIGGGWILGRGLDGGAGAFDGCYRLTSITIPSSVTKISEGAFRGCTSLVSVSIQGSSVQIAGNAFEGTPYLERPKMERLKEQGLCVHCGGKFGLFGKCKNCGQKRDC